MNNFDIEIKCSDQILKAIAKINGDTLTVSSVNLRSQSSGNTAGAA
ncbi:hypothetical protein [Candidatus Nitrotoga sp. 1052]|nr:hypothetical protein [Candidatus Nitrotoga sp. 1052]